MTVSYRGGDVMLLLSYVRRYGQSKLLTVSEEAGTGLAITHCRNARPNLGTPNIQV
jgi:hypothetical protein